MKVAEIEDAKNARLQRELMLSDKVKLYQWYFEELSLAEDKWDCNLLMVASFIETINPDPEFAYTGPVTWAAIVTQDYLPFLQQSKLFGMTAVNICGCNLCLNPFAQEGEINFFPGFKTLRNIRYAEL